MDFEITKEPSVFNQALFRVTHGLYILTAKKDEKINGQCLDALMQVTNMPPRVAIGVGQRSLTHEMILNTGKFTVNVIDRECLKCYDYVKHFGFQSGRKVDKFASVEFVVGENGLPILSEALAFYECSVVPEMKVNLGTHTLFIGLIERAGTKRSGEPLTYNEYRKMMRKGV